MKLDRIVLTTKFNALGKLYEVFDATSESYVSGDQRNSKAITLLGDCVEVELKILIKDKYSKLLIPVSNCLYLVPTPIVDEKIVDEKKVK